MKHLNTQFSTTLHNKTFNIPPLKTSIKHAFENFNQHAFENFVFVSTGVNTVAMVHYV